MTTPKVSLIIPVYNAEKYLRSCLSSATGQTLSDIEIICVDDCSTDSSHQLLTSYANQKSNIRIIRHEKNRGEGAARNTGLDNARGEYIFHLDADDTIPPDALEKLYEEAAKFKSDMVKGRYDIVHEDGSINKLDWSTPDNKIVNTNIYISEFLQKIPTSHCTYLYNRHFLDTYKIRYRSDLCIGLDLIALTDALIHAGTVTLIPEIVYYYFQSKESAIRGKLKFNTARDAIRTKKIIFEMLKTNGLAAAATSLLKAWDYIISTHWLRMPSSLTNDECSTIFSEFRTLINGANVRPWTHGTPHHYRYILALVLSNHDKEALSFLQTEEAEKGFSDGEVLIARLNQILSIYPDDIGALTEMGYITRKEGNLEQSLHYFNEAIKHDPDNYGAHLQSAIIAKELKLFDEVHDRLDSALNILIADLDSSEQIKRVTRLMEDLMRSKLNTTRNELIQVSNELIQVSNELNRVHGELNGMRIQLNEVYSSLSWKVTAPLRKIKSALKRIT
ncbi:glycosyltransferase [bacterium]|nr:glycosyltransferase [bacterium]